MVTNSIRTRRRYPDYDKADMDNLARSKAWLNVSGMKEQSAFTSEEADRRVAFYAAQVQAAGQITQWLAAAAPKPKSRYRTRFAFGDAMGKHGCAC